MWFKNDLNSSFDFFIGHDFHRKWGKKGREDEKAKVLGASETVAQTNTSSVCVSCGNILSRLNQ